MPADSHTFSAGDLNRDAAQAQYQAAFTAHTLAEHAEQDAYMEFGPDSDIYKDAKAVCWGLWIDMLDAESRLMAEAPAVEVLHTLTRDGEGWRLVVEVRGEGDRHLSRWTWSAEKPSSEAIAQAREALALEVANG